MKVNNLVLVHELGKEILGSENMKREKRFLQHGNISTYDHSIGVAAMSLALVNILRTKVDKVSLVRGALLHDFFLYDLTLSYILMELKDLLQLLKILQQQHLGIS